MPTRNCSTHRTMRVIFATVLVALLVLSFAGSVFAVSRTTITSRGKSWIDRAVPYSQSTYFEGYRQDCSGFLSMCWVLSRNGLPLSLSTADLDAPGLVVPIAKEELQPGDMILRPKDQLGAAYGHAVLFVGWADPAHTRYIGYHESSSGAGAVMANITYPFWGETGFSPYRYLNVDDDYLETIQPVYGQSRYETCVQSSWVAFPRAGDAGAVVLATGENWPDALGGAALAGAVDGPVLLTLPDTLPEVIRAEIDRLDVSKVYLLGGGSSVATAVADAVDAIPGVTVQRIGGTDRWDTAALVASETRTRLLAAGRAVDGVYVAPGADFPDALAASPAAYTSGRPILLSAQSALPTRTAEAMGELGVDRAWIIGGMSAVGATATAQIEALDITVQRISGANRYETALALAQHSQGLGLSWRNLGIATGLSYADALAGGVAQGATGSMLLLTHPGSLNAGVAGQLAARRTSIVKVRCFGGTAAVSDAARAQIDSAMGGS
ncbi:MAG: cell wall-binding repeat-containing protein [Coriobacteriia bacterium]|nr:cell wall-binding repeat-containing protein [Coriobacteriia bacterium]